MKILLRTVASIFFLLNLSSACMITHIIYDVASQSILSGSLSDNNGYQCSTAFDSLALSSATSVVFTCYQGDWNAQLNYDGNQNWVMEVSPGGYRDVVGFALQKKCASSYDALVNGEEVGVSVGELPCNTIQLTAFEYMCTEEDRNKPLATKVRRRGMASS